MTPKTLQKCPVQTRQNHILPGPQGPFFVNFRRELIRRAHHFEPFQVTPVSGLHCQYVCLAGRKAERETRMSKCPDQRHFYHF